MFALTDGGDTHDSWKDTCALLSLHKITATNHLNARLDHSHEQSLHRYFVACRQQDRKVIGQPHCWNVALTLDYIRPPLFGFLGVSFAHAKQGFLPELTAEHLCTLYKGLYLFNASTAFAASLLISPFDLFICSIGWYRHLCCMLVEIHAAKRESLLVVLHLPAH